MRVKQHNLRQGYEAVLFQLTDEPARIQLDDFPEGVPGLTRDRKRVRDFIAIGVGNNYGSKSVLVSCFILV